MELNDLTDQQRELLRDCASPEDVLKVAQDEGIELSDAQLEAVSGGLDWGDGTGDAS